MRASTSRRRASGRCRSAARLVLDLAAFSPLSAIAVTVDAGGDFLARPPRAIGDDRAAVVDEYGAVVDNGVDSTTATWKNSERATGVVLHGQLLQLPLQSPALKSPASDLHEPSTFLSKRHKEQGMSCGGEDENDSCGGGADEAAVGEKLTSRYPRWHILMFGKEVQWHVKAIRKQYKAYGMGKWDPFPSDEQIAKALKWDLKSGNLTETYTNHYDSSRTLNEATSGFNREQGGYFGGDVKLLERKPGAKPAAAPVAKLAAKSVSLKKMENVPFGRQEVVALLTTLNGHLGGSARLGGVWGVRSSSTAAIVIGTEFLENGALHLNGEVKPSGLPIGSPWSTRGGGAKPTQEQIFVARAEDHVKILVCRLLKNLLELHRFGIAHLDVKPPNIGAGSMRLLDFGGGKLSPTGFYSEANLYSVGYSAPELYLLDKQLPFSLRADVFAVGTMVLQLIRLERDESMPFPFAVDWCPPGPGQGEDTSPGCYFEHRVWPLFDAVFSDRSSESKKNPALSRRDGAFPKTKTYQNLYKALRGPRTAPTDSVTDFVSRILVPDCFRMSAREALRHPWLQRVAQEELRGAAVLPAESPLENPKCGEGQTSPPPNGGISKQNEVPVHPPKDAVKPDEKWVKPEANASS